MLAGERLFLAGDPFNLIASWNGIPLATVNAR